jgi:hypothetical protein
MKTHLAAVVIALGVLPAICSAQILNCDGVITNKPCQGGQAVFEEKPYQAPSPQELEQQKRESWVRDLETARLKVKREHGLDVDVTLTIDLCRTGSLEDCRKAIQQKEHEINQLLIAKISTEQKKSEQQTEGQEPQNVAITIIQDNSDYYNLSGRRQRTHQPVLSPEPTLPSIRTPAVAPPLPRKRPQGYKISPNQPPSGSL